MNPAASAIPRHAPRMRPCATADTMRSAATVVIFRRHCHRPKSQALPVLATFIARRPLKSDDRHLERTSVDVRPAEVLVYAAPYNNSTNGK